MPRRTRAAAIPHSDLMTRRTRDRILLPVAAALLLLIISLSTALAGMVYAPLVTGGLALVPLVMAVYELRRLIADSRSLIAKTLIKEG